MKRQKYLFRAKYIDSNTWVYGGGVWEFSRGRGDGTCLMIGEDHNGEIVVKPVKKETVGQYTGIKDSRGRRIFENDILKGVGSRGEQLVVVKLPRPGRGCDPFVEIADQGWQSADGEECLIIGNIIDKPKLLKEYHAEQISVDHSMPGDPNQELGKSV